MKFILMKTALTDEASLCYRENMRIFVCSDTHGNYLETLQAISLAGAIDFIIHLGDEIDDATMLEQMTAIPTIKIAGNCDRCWDEKRERCEEIGGYRIFLTHGDSYNVKSGLSELLAKASAERARIVLFGHTHVAIVQQIDGMLVINPGTMHQRSADKSFAILTIETDTPSAEIIPYTSLP
jgi:putative phosphoesterase